MIGKFDPHAYSYEFDTWFYDSSDPLPTPVVREGTPINAYKRFKAIKNGQTYYISGVTRGYRS